MRSRTSQGWNPAAAADDPHLLGARRSAMLGKLLRACARRPLDSIGLIAVTAAAGAIVANALHLQQGSHPAPILSASRRVSAPVETTGSLVVMPRPRPPEPAVAKDAPTAKSGPERSRPAPPAPLPPRRTEAAADTPAPSTRVAAIQRALADFGYGQIKPTGVFDTGTQSAIERFERERKLPVSGQISDRLTRELSAVTGRPLD